jgi:hypothetical protein
VSERYREAGREPVNGFAHLKYVHIARSRVLATSLLTAMAVGCTLAGASATTAASQTSTGPYADNDTAAQRHAETVAYAKRIIAERPVLGGESAYTGTVPKKYRQPDEFPGATNRLGRSYYATIDESPHHVFKQLKAQTVSHSRLGGWGDVGAGPNAHRYAWVRFDRDVLPAEMVDGELIIEIQGYPHKPTLLAEFSWAVPHPAWPKAERIPPANAKAKIARIKYSKRHRVLARHKVKLDATAAESLATAFDNSWIAPPWACTGGGIVRGPYIEYHVRMRSHGHSWRVTPGVCGVSQVTLDANDYLPGVNASKDFAHLVRKDTHHT